MITLEYRKCGPPTSRERAVNQNIQPPVDILDVGFDRYMIVYNDREDCEALEAPAGTGLSSGPSGDRVTYEPNGVQWASRLSIGCYKGERIVGRLHFCNEAANPPESSVAPDGLVLLWFSLDHFDRILDLLRHESNLSLSLLRNAAGGTQLSPPVGALLIGPELVGEQD